MVRNIFPAMFKIEVSIQLSNLIRSLVLIGRVEEHWFFSFDSDCGIVAITRKNQKT